MTENNNLIEYYKVSYDHHKEFMVQRTKCFNFYLIIISIIFGILYENNSFIYQLILAIFVFCISVCFFIMDFRTKKLLEYLEKLLLDYEQINIPKSMRLFSEEKKAKEKMKSWLSLTWVYRVIFLLVPLFLIVTTILNKIYH